MALVIADRVRETTSSTGTGTVTLTGPFSGFQPFSVIGNGNTTYYCIIDASTGAFEVGIGTYTTSGNTLSRTTVLSSSNSGSPVSFAAGVKDVICTQPAERAVYVEGTNIVANNAATLPITTVGGLGTGVATALAVNVGTAGAPVVNGGVLGTPSSGTVTNLTGTASININGTVGATTPSTGAFTTLSATGVTTVQAGTAALPAITTTGDTNTGIFFPTADTIAFTEGGVEAMRIDSAGNVGIGTTTTTQRFNVIGGRSRFQANADLFSLQIEGASGAGQYYIGATNEASPSLVFSNVGGTERMRITDAGNVGIGTTSPGAKLDVNGGALIEGLTVGRGAGAISGNTTVGASALAGGSQTGTNLTALGFGTLNVNSSGGNNTAIGASVLQNNTTASDNTVVGYRAGFNNTTGASNTALGTQALQANTTASNNTAVGYQAGYSNTTGNSSQFFGYQAGYSHITGAQNVAIGDRVMHTGATTGNNNIAIGAFALDVLSSGNFNVAVGSEALKSNTTASNNTAVGYQAGYSNTTGGVFDAFGAQALYSHTTGFANAAFGFGSSYSMTTGNQNSSFGRDSLRSTTTGASNVAIGRDALYSNTTASNNTAVGFQAGYALTTGATNCFVGYGTATAATTGSRNVSVGDRRLDGGDIFNLTTESDRAIFAHNNITNAYVKVAWTVTSDARDKTNINPIPHGLDFVKQLNPVSYNFRKSREDDTPHGNKRYGFLAQDILALEGENNVIIDNEQADHLKYQGEALVPVLVKAIQEQQAIITTLTTRITALEQA